MPGGDGTGPRGLGPMTGRAAGYCAGHPVPGYMNPVFGRGAWSGGAGWFAYGRGRGGGRGWRNRYYAAGMPERQGAAYGYPDYGFPPYPYYPELTPEQEKDMLEAQAEALKEELEDIQSHIRTMEKAQSQEETK